MKFAYLNFQGRGQVSRLLLAYTQLQHEDIQYQIQNLSEWFNKDKQQLNLDFPSLPYLVDQNLKFTQSKAIQRYIIYKAKRSDLLGRNSKEIAQIQNVQGVLREVFTVLIELFLDSKFQENRKHTYEKIKQKLNYLDLFIGQKDYFFTRITYPDFILSVIFNYLKQFYPYECNIWKNIERVSSNINQIEEIKCYFRKIDSVSKTMPNIKSQNPIYHNLKPLYEEIISVQVSVTTLSVEQKQISNSIQKQLPVVNDFNNYMQKVNKKQNQQIQQEVYITQNQNTSQTLLTQIQSILQSQAKVKQSEITQAPSLNTKMSFQDRVQGYIKAAQQTKIIINDKNLSIISNNILQKSTSSTSWIKKDTKINVNQKVQNKEKNIKLGYWGIRGLAQIQRHLLAYSGLEFTQIFYKTQQEWFNGDKLKLGLPFPNLPYLIDGQFQLTQSLAIDRYIIKRSGNYQILGKNLNDETYIQNTVRILSEFFKELRILCFIEDPQQKKAQQILVKISSVFQKINNFINDKPHVFEYLTLIDFYIAEISYYIEKIFPLLYERFRFLSKIRLQVQYNIRVKSYYEREKYIKAPFMPPTAKIYF